MKPELEKLHNGGSFDDFYKSTKNQWDKIAMFLMRKWPLPEAVEHEDVVQQLLMAVVNLLPKYDPTKSNRIDLFFTINAINQTKQWLHKQRGAQNIGSNGDNEPSHIPIEIVVTEHLSQKVAEPQEKVREIREILNQASKGNPDTLKALESLVRNGFDIHFSMTEIEQEVKDVRAAMIAAVAGLSGVKKSRASTIVGRVWAKRFQA